VNKTRFTTKSAYITYFSTGNQFNTTDNIFEDFVPDIQHLEQSKKKFPSTKELITDEFHRYIGLLTIFWLKIPNATYFTDKKMPNFQQYHLR